MALVCLQPADFPVSVSSVVYLFKFIMIISDQSHDEHDDSKYNAEDSATYIGGTSFMILNYEIRTFEGKFPCIENLSLMGAIGLSREAVEVVRTHWISVI